MKIQFLSFPGCPSAPGGLAVLERVVARLGLADRIEEVDMTAPETAEELRDWASPTILIDGVDAGGEMQPNGPGCRMYETAEGGLTGIPPEELISAAIQRAAK